MFTFDEKLRKDFQQFSHDATAAAAVFQNLFWKIKL